MTSTPAVSEGSTERGAYSAVVLYYKLGPRLADTIDALLEQDPLPFKIVVVDNNSQDGVAREICDRYPECTLVTLSTNMGYSGGMAAGISHLGGALNRVLLLTHEVILDSACLGQLTDAMDRRPELVLAGPSLTRGVERAVWSLGGKFAKFASVEHIVEEADNTRVEWLDGACLLVRVSALTQIGGLDLDYFVYWEDVDLSTRLARVGDIDCIRTAYASQETSLTPTYFKSRNQILFWRKRHDRLKVAQAISIALLKVLIRDLPRGELRVIRARMTAILHGLSGKLTLRFSDVRVQ